jgi:hypothetical protein
LPKGRLSYPAFGGTGGPPVRAGEPTPLLFEIELTFAPQIG